MHTYKQSKYQNTTQNIGTGGEIFMSEFIKNKGYLIYKTNIRKIGFEIDIAAYKRIGDDFLDIRLIEVKTRSSPYKVSLSDLGLYKKVSLYIRNKGIIARDIVELVNKTQGVVCKYKISIDLSIVTSFTRGKVKSFVISKYYKDINLLM